MFKVTVEGLYIARSPHSEKEKIKKPYIIEGRLPSLSCALSVVKNKLLGPALSKKYPDYVYFLTHHITQVEALDLTAEEELARADVQYMDRSALLRYIKANALAVDPSFFPGLAELREAVTDAKEDPEGFAKRFELKKPDLLLSAQIAAANPELFEGSRSSALPVREDGLQGVEVKRAARTPAERLSTNKKQTEARLGGLKADMVRDGELEELPKDL